MRRSCRTQRHTSSSTGELCSFHIEWLTYTFPVCGMEIYNPMAKQLFKDDLKTVYRGDDPFLFLYSKHWHGLAVGTRPRQSLHFAHVCSCLCFFFVLFSFSRKSSDESIRERQKVIALANLKEPSLLQFYISREWLNKFNTFTEPGPITNHTFLCQHGGKQIMSHLLLIF